MITTLLRIALIEEKLCPECLSLLNRKCRCKNKECRYNAGKEYDEYEDSALYDPRDEKGVRYYDPDDVVD